MLREGCIAKVCQGCVRGENKLKFREHGCWYVGGRSTVLGKNANANAVGIEATQGETEASDEQSVLTSIPAHF